MNATIDNDRHMLSDALQHTILALSLSQAECARSLGVTRQAVNRWLNQFEIPGALMLMRFSRIASGLGDDRIADLFSADGKRTRPVPTVFETTLNGLLDDEIADNTEAIGQALSAYRTGRFDEAACHAKRGIGVLFRLLAEIDAQRDGGPSPTGDALPLHSIILKS